MPVSEYILHFINSSVDKILFVVGASYQVMRGQRPVNREQITDTPWQNNTCPTVRKERDEVKIR